MIARFLMLWLKQCIVPSLPKDAIAINMLYPVVLLAYGRPFGLLSAMVCNLQSGLQMLYDDFLLEDKSKGKATEVPIKMKSQILR